MILDARGNPIPPRRAPAEIGFGGAQVFGGIVLDDYNPDLQGTKAVEVADRMRRSDAQIRAVEKVVSLPLRATSWLIEEPDRPTAAEQEAAELLRRNLFGGMEHSWDDLLREACLAIYYGFRIPEIVWEERAGLLAIQRVAGRNPRLVERWLYDRGGRLLGYLYSGDRPKGEGLTVDGGSGVEHVRVAVPLEKTLHFAYDAENDNPAGFGLWRSMYPHWYYKQAIYKVMGIGIERNLLGVPVAEQGEGAQADDGDAILTLLSRLRAAEDAGMRLPYGWKLSWFESQRSPMDAMPFLLHQDVKIAQVALAQFLNLGQGKEGTQALATEQVKVFLDAEEANARWIEETLNAQLVARWCRYNYGPGLRPPAVRHRRIQARSLEALAQMLQQLVTGQLVHPTIQDEEYLRDLAELPAIPREQLVRQQADRQAEAERRGQSGPDGPAERPEQRATPWRLAAGQREEEDADRAARRSREEGFAEQARQHLTTLHQAYLRALRPLIEEANTSGDQGQSLARLAEVPVPGAARYVEFLRGWLWQVFYQGRQALADETGREPGDKPVPNRTRQWVAARAEAVAAHHLGLLRAETLNRVLTGLRARLPAADILSDAEATGVERLQRLVRGDWHAGAMELAEQASREPLG